MTVMQNFKKLSRKEISIALFFIDKIPSVG